MSDIWKLNTEKDRVGIGMSIAYLSFYLTSTDACFFVQVVKNRRHSAGGVALFKALTVGGCCRQGRRIEAEMAPPGTVPIARP